MSVLSGTVHLPGAGDVPKKYLAGGGAALAGYVVYRYYRARQEAEDDAAAADTPGYADGSEVLPIVPGAVGGVGVSGGETTTTVDSGRPSTNAAWTNLAADGLEAAGLSRATVLNALGDYLARRPLSTSEQQIVQSAIALAGYPPEGTYSIIPGGDVAITTAPVITGVTTTTTTAVVSFSAVPGAGYYRAYRTGAAGTVGATETSPVTVYGLAPNTAYTFYVSADASANAPGPRSAGYEARTKAVVLAKPSAPKITSITKSSAVVTTGAVPGATYYHWYVNGGAHGASDHPTYTLTQLKAGTRYSVAVAADSTTQNVGPTSTATTFTTKKS